MHILLHCRAGIMCRLCALCYVRLVCVLCWIKCVLTDLDTDQLYCCCSCIGLVRLAAWSDLAGRSAMLVSMWHMYVYMCSTIRFSDMFTFAHVSSVAFPPHGHFRPRRAGGNNHRHPGTCRSRHRGVGCSHATRHKTELQYLSPCVAGRTLHEHTLRQ